MMTTVRRIPFLLLLAAVLTAPALAQTNTPSPGSEQLSAQLGLNTSHGNSESISISASIDWNENIGRIEHELDFNTYVSQALEGEGQLSDSQSLDWAIRRAFGDAKTRRWFALAHLGGNRNEYSGVGLRAIVGPGLGRHVVDRKDMRITLEGGVAAAWEKQIGGTTDQFAMPFFHPMMHWDFSKNGYLSQTLEFEFNGENDADVRINSDTEISFRVSDRISIRPSIKVNWDNRPMQGAESLDVTTQTSFSYSFYRQSSP